MIDTPNVRRQFVGMALRRYREMNGYRADVAAKVIGCDRSTISRVETGQRGIRLAHLKSLLDEYGVDEEEQAVLMVMARPEAAIARPSSLVHVLRDHYALEMTATEIWVYQPVQIPDLLQTPDYARALADGDCRTPSDDAREKLVTAKLTWQAMIVADGWSTVQVVVTEGALRQIIGGPSVMRAQLARLAEFCGYDPRISVQVLPFALGAHAESGNGPLTILRITRSPGLGIVHMHGTPGNYLIDQGDVATQMRAFTMAKAQALSPAESADLIRDLADTL